MGAGYQGFARPETCPNSPDSVCSISQKVAKGCAGGGMRRSQGAIPVAVGQERASSAPSESLRVGLVQFNGAMERRAEE